MQRSIHASDFDSAANHVHSSKHSKRNSVKGHADPHAPKHRQAKNEPEEALSATDPCQIDFVRMESLIDPDIDKQGQGQGAAVSGTDIQVIT